MTTAVRASNLATRCNGWCTIDAMGEPTDQEQRDRINEFLQRFGRERDISLAPLSEQGVGKLQRGSAVLTIHVLPEQGVVLFVSHLMKVPDGNREGLYRKLLELSFLATSDAAYAIDRATNEVYLRALRQLEGLDYEEFEDLVHTVASVADQWDDELRAEFAA